MNSKGFTLLELLIVVAIVAILATVAVPNFGPLVSTNRMDTIQDRLVTSLSQARSEAIRQGVDVQLCPRSSVNTVVNSCGTSWQNGWLVIANGTGLRVEDSIATSLTLTGASVTFSSDGATTSNASICFTVDDGDDSTDTRYIQISRFGRIKAWDSDGDVICGS
ncbi:MAG: GspH/FimT family pseudopilin [Pontibacterium sp.]